MGNGWQNYPIAIRFIYTYPQPVTAKTGSAPWSNFNRYGWSIFARRQQAWILIEIPMNQSIA
jgi:hypothetical protein